MSCFGPLNEIRKDIPADLPVEVHSSFPLGPAGKPHSAMNSSTMPYHHALTTLHELLEKKCFERKGLLVVLVPPLAGR